MFQGRWPHSLNLDAKKRLALPARVREGLSGGTGSTELMVGVLQEKCLYLHDTAQHERFLDRIFGQIGDTRDSRKLKTYILSRFMPVSTDSQGRMTVPQVLLDLAEIKKEVVLISQNSRVEVWGAEHFAALEAEAEAGALDDALEAVFQEEEAENRMLRRAQSPAGEGEVPTP